MRETGAALALLVAGCASHDSRHDAIAPAGDPLLVLWYGDSDLGFGCVHVSRQGTAEAHFEPGSAIRKNPLLRGVLEPRHSEGIPAGPAEIAAIERAFAAIPPGETTWAVAEETPRDDGVRCPPRGDGGSSRYRAMHLTSAGEVRRVTVYQGPPGTLPKDARPAGPDLAALYSAVGRIVNPNLSSN